MAVVTSLDDDHIVYAAKPWTLYSQALAAIEPEDGSLPAGAEGMAYLLEVSLINDVLAAWSRHRSGTTPTLQEACNAVIHYATHDAFLMPAD